MTKSEIEKGFEIVPLSRKNIAEATVLIHSVFPDEASAEIKPGDALSESLTGNPPHKDWGIRSLCYFLLSEKESGRIIGSTGLYAATDEPAEVIWLGWFSIHPAFRGKQLGRFLLEWTIDESKRCGHTTLRLYTSRNPSEEVAQILYEKMGFRITGREQTPEDTYEILFREKVL